ncbi:MAG: dicarboxylate/amino acid:cation symporter [Armatimonadetes bacterium]|nr:dicarboxylate/amino acid:cation symporter [Armatimonadota bacterium]
MDTGHAEPLETTAKKNWYTRVPLYIKIIIALVLGAILGLIAPGQGWDMEKLKWISDLVLRMLRTLATPLIFSAVLGSIIGANITGKKAGRLMWLLISNSVVAIVIGLVVANVLQPGQHLRDHMTQGAASNKEPYNLWQHLFDSIPSDFITPFQKNDIISILVLAIALGCAMRILLHSSNEQVSRSVRSLQNVLNALFQIVITVLKWVFELVPLAVFAVVARVVGSGGLGKLAAMGYWIGSVVTALALMMAFYLIRMMISSKTKPGDFLRGGSDAFAMAFSTASSAATLPVTYRCATDKLGIRPDNANMGIMVGGTFNHDGTALYEAMAALLIAQGLGQHLNISQQIVVVLMAIIASVGAAGIPEAGLVTMIAVFHAVNLPIEYIPMLLTVDWFLDRCRTTINVMGDMASTCILDAKD